MVDKFRDVYNDLYNSAESSEACDEIKARLQQIIGQNSMLEVDKITAEVVKQAVCNMKSGKADVSDSYSSDLLLHSPDCVFDELAAVFRSFLVHGTPACLCFLAIAEVT